MHTINRTELSALAVGREFCHTGRARELRLRRHLTLGEIAAACGTSPDRIMAWETGRVRPYSGGAFRTYLEILAELTTLDEADTA